MGRALEHRHAIPVKFEHLAFRGNAPHGMHDPAGDGFDFLVAHVEFHGPRRRLEFHPRINHIGIRPDLADGHAHLVEFVLNIAQNFLENVFDGNQSVCAAVFVRDDRDVLSGAAHGFQQVIQFHRVGYMHHGPYKPVYRFVLRRRVRQHVECAYHAHDLVDAVPVDGDARKARVGEKLNQFAPRRRAGQCLHVDARHHDLVCLLLLQVDDRMDHLPLLGFERTMVRAFIDQRPHVLD